MQEKKKNQSKLNIQAINSEYGKVPPQASDLEAIVLGSMMLEKDKVFEVVEILTSESFYNEAHKIIFKTIIELSEKLQPIDILTVTELLRAKNLLEEVGGAYYITQLTNRVASAAHIQFHARIIQQKYIQRELIRVSTEIQNKAYDSSLDITELLDFSERELYNIWSGNIKKEGALIKDVISESIRQIEEASKREDGLSGVPCGFSELDRITSGWQKSDMIVIAARPSMGKTAFVLSMLRNIAVLYKQPVALFSLEMSSIQLVNRLIVGETGLASEKIKTGKLSNAEWVQLEVKIKDLTEAPIYIDDTPAISIFELRAKCRRLKSMHDIQLVVIDYLQLMSGTGDSGSREQEVSNISRGLKAVAKELDIPIIALSQLNRGVELRGGDKRPMISDLRESGAIEQDADIVIFIHRPERYGITEDEEGNSTKGKAEIIIAKHRNGAVCDVTLRFINEQARFTDWDGTDIIQTMDSDLIPANNGMTFGSKMNNDFTQNTSADDLEFGNNMPFANEDAPF
ncbi:MAG: replicative DNA helicase [Bacteroidia bacterium]|nr:MAG: replicative DNA helicase [Bacteroidia bacterium]